jgi:single-strand DNA-binding protein
MVNKVILIGNVGVDPEVKYLENNTAVCNLRLATSETYRNKNGEKVTNTEWHNVVLWRRLAEIAEKYVRKGSPLYIEGKIRTRSWDDKDGNRRYTTEIFADNLQLLGRKSDNNSDNQGSSSYQSNAPDNQPNASSANNNYSDNNSSYEDVDNDDLPF